MDSNSTIASAAVISSPEFEKTQTCAWTVEQQMQEVETRWMGLQMLIRAPISFSPRPTDVIIVTSLKSGTTWTAHICHQIRTKGAEPDFENQIPDVIMTFEIAHLLIKDGTLDALIQPAEPRIFFTHHEYSTIPKGGKLIYCFRDQKDALYSNYMFQDTLLWLKERVISLPVFAEVITKKFQWTANSLRDLLVWWEHRHDKDVLLLFFDDLKEDHAGCVKRIAKFMGVDCDEETIARIVHTTTHAEMVKHHSKFDNHNFITANPSSELTGRVRKDGGKTGDGKKLLPPDVQQSIDQEWQDIITTKLGYGDLNEMRTAWKKEIDKV
ncbi:hypothetical protein EMCRGX_G027755 [Ephydatia muelleri]|eukprot:Em0020g848a